MHGVAKERRARRTPIQPGSGRSLGAGSRRSAMNEITKELLDALKTIESWKSHTTAYAVDFGSNGVRDFYRAIARQSIAKAEAALAAPHNHERNNHHVS